MKRLIVFCLIVFSILTLVGCNNLSPEEKKYQEELKREYEMLGRTYIVEELYNKYGIDFEIVSLNVKQYLDTVWPVYTGEYSSSVEAVVKYDSKLYDVYANIEDGNECLYDNYQKDIIEEDFKNYIFNIFQVNPIYISHYLFTDVGSFYSESGLTDIKYNGDIEEYIKERTKNYSYLYLFFDNISIENFSIEYQEVFSNFEKCYIINLSNTEFFNPTKDFTMMSGWYDNLIPNIRDSWKLSNNGFEYWKNDMQYFYNFIYKGDKVVESIEDFKSNKSIDLSNWVVFENSRQVLPYWIELDKGEIIYLKTDLIKNYNSSNRYDVYSCWENSDGETQYGFREIYNSDFESGYIEIEGRSKGCFTIFCREYN